MKGGDMEDLDLDYIIVKFKKKKTLRHNDEENS